VAWDRFALTFSFEGSACTVALRGSLDADSVIALESQFDQMLSGQFERIILDVGGLRDLDEAGSRTLGRLGALVARGGVGLFLRDGTSTIECNPGVRPGDGEGDAAITDRPTPRPAR